MLAANVSDVSTAAAAALKGRLVEGNVTNAAHITHVCRADLTSFLQTVPEPFLEVLDAIIDDLAEFLDDAPFQAPRTKPNLTMTHLNESRSNADGLPIRTNLALLDSVKPSEGVIHIEARVRACKALVYIGALGYVRLPKVLHSKPIFLGDVADALQEHSYVLSERREVREEAPGGARPRRNGQVMTPFLQSGNAGVIHFGEAGRVAITLHLACVSVLINSRRDTHLSKCTNL